MKLDECPKWGLGPNNENVLQWEKAMKKFFRKMPAGFTFTSYSLKACGVEVLVKKVLANEKKLRQGGAGPHHVPHQRVQHG